MQQNFDPHRLKRLAQSPTGQQLMEALKQSGGSDLEKAATLASAGNMEQARQSLSFLLADPQIRALLEQLEEQL